MRSGITSAFDSKRTLRESPRGLGVDLPIDEKYYREISPGSMAEQLLISARNRIFQDFRAHVQPSHSDQVLDVGVSDIVNDGANVLERSYPHQQNITACGLGAGVQF
ncbi:MAG: hypothetical protein WA366_12165, partial [Pseudolabrys sp.]